MANQARNERQVMRQRGAGRRDVSNADFGLNLDAGSRQQRQLMRQRGAGNRQISNVDFGIAFTTPIGLGGRRSRTRSKTPGTATRQHKSAETMPAKHDVQPALQKSHSVKSVQDRSLPGPQERSLTVGRSEQPQRKRRRLSEVSEMSRATSFDLPLASIDNHIFNEAVGFMDGEPEDHSGDGRQYEAAPSSPLFFPNDSARTLEQPDKENEPTSASVIKATSKKRKRRSIGQQSLFRKKRNSGASKQQIPSPPYTAEDDNFQEPSEVDSSSHVRDRRWSVESVEPTPGPSPQRAKPVQKINETPVLNNALSKPRRKRKSITQSKKKRKSIDTVTSTPSQIVNSIEQSEELTPGGQPREDELNELSLDAIDRSNMEVEDDQPQSRKTRFPTSTNSKRFRSEEAQQIPENDDNDVDETYLPDENSPEPTPAVGRFKQNQQQQRNKSRKQRPPKGSGIGITGIRKKSSKSTIPILTYRATNTHTLPTIFEVAEEDRVTGDLETDELALAALPAITTRTTPNAVDVMAQACHEVIESAVSDLKAQSSETNISRSELNKGVTALQSFQSHLSAILFNTSQSLDQRLNLEARLRKSRREKTELQARWLEIRRRRDQLDLRKDEIRREHWENEVLERKRFEASEAAFGLETAVARQQDNEATGQGQELELMLRSLAGEVSNKCDDGNVPFLQSLRDFNSKLERLAIILG